MPATTDPWEDLHAKFAPMLLAEARMLARVDPHYEPVGMVLGADAAMEPPFQALVRAGGGRGFRRGNTMSMTFPRELMSEIFRHMGRAPDLALPRRRNGRRVLTILAITAGEMHAFHEEYEDPQPAGG